MPPKPFCPPSLEGLSLTPWEHLKPQNIKPCLGGHCGGKRKTQTMHCTHLSRAAERRGSHEWLCLLSELSSAPHAPGTLTLSPEQPRALPGKPLQALTVPLGSTHRAQPRCPPAHHAAPRRCTGKGRETCLLRKPCFLWLEGGDVPLGFGVGFPSLCRDIFTYKGGFALRGAVWPRCLCTNSALSHLRDKQRAIARV